MNEIALRLAARVFDRPVIQNDYRSTFVEAMLQPYLEDQGWEYVGHDWGCCDFKHKLGGMLEVKQSAAWQTWDEKNGCELPKGGKGSFDIALRKGMYEGKKYTKFNTPKRPAHVYVFAWHGLTGSSADHRDPDQWEFFVVPKVALPDVQKKISLSRLRGIAARCVIGPERCGEGLSLYLRYPK
jgi:hypothetical protein